MLRTGNSPSHSRTSTTRRDEIWRQQWGKALICTAESETWATEPCPGSARGIFTSWQSASSRTPTTNASSPCTPMGLTSGRSKWALRRCETLARTSAKWAQSLRSAKPSVWMSSVSCWIVSTSPSLPICWPSIHFPDFSLCLPSHFMWLYHCCYSSVSVVLCILQETAMFKYCTIIFTNHSSYRKLRDLRSSRTWQRILLTVSRFDWYRCTDIPE